MVKKNNKGIKYLVCVDDSIDFKEALAFACKQAKLISGSLTLLYVIEFADFRHWQGVEDIMKEEARDKADEILQKLSSEIENKYKIRPHLIIKEGDKLEEIIKLAEHNKKERVDNIVIGAAVEGEGSNTLLNSLIIAITKSIKLPITIVPGNLNNKN